MSLIIFYVVGAICVLSVPFSITFLRAFLNERKRSDYLLDKLIELKKLYIDDLNTYKVKIDYYEKHEKERVAKKIQDESKTNKRTRG